MERRGCAAWWWRVPARPKGAGSAQRCWLGPTVPARPNVAHSTSRRRPAGRGTVRPVSSRMALTSFRLPARRPEAGFPLDLPLLAGVDELALDPGVTILVGEN